MYFNIPRVADVKQKLTEQVKKAEEAKKAEAEEKVEIESTPDQTEVTGTTEDAIAKKVAEMVYESKQMDDEAKQVDGMLRL